MTSVEPGRPGLFHTGVVVPDLNRAMDEMEAALGIRWRAVTEIDMLMNERGTDFEATMRFVYSADGPHFLELIEGIAGTVWDSSSGPRLHHIGYSVDDVDGVAAHLASLGLSCVAGNSTSDGAERRFTYHESAYAPRIELMSSAVRQRIEAPPS